MRAVGRQEIPDLASMTPCILERSPIHWVVAVTSRLLSLQSSHDQSLSVSYPILRTLGNAQQVNHRHISCFLFLLLANFYLL